MFVSSNSFSAILSHFKERLGHLFSESEIRVILFEAIRTRFKDPKLSKLEMTSLRFSESDLLYFREVRNRLLQNEPIQYILQRVHFYGLDLIVDSRALIPRPETEELVSWIVQDLKSPERIVDLCSGSGCIAFALKSASPESCVLAVEISEEAHGLIRENMEFVGISVEPVHADVLQIQETASQIGLADIIVSNPPYVLHSDKALMQKNVLDYEPHLALFVEDHDPLLFYKAIAEISNLALRKGGLLYFEFHENYEKDVNELMSAYGFVNIEVRKDLQGKSRMLRCEK